MPGLLKIRCPKCESLLKVNGDQAVGRKVACPKCSAAFVVKSRRKPAPPKDDFDAAFGGGAASEYGFDDAGDDFGDDFGSFDEFGNVRRPSPARKPKKKKRPKKKGMPTGLKVGLIVGGSLVGMLVMGGLIWLAVSLLGGGTASVEEVVAYLAEDSEMIVVIRVDQILKEDDVRDRIKPMMEDPKFKKFLTETGLSSIDDVELIAFGLQDVSQMRGFSGGRNLPPGMKFIIRAKKAVDTASLASDSTKLSHEGEEYFKDTKSSMAAWLPDQRTIIVAAEADLKQIIEQGGSGSISETRFKFVDFSQQIVFAYAPKSGSLIPDDQKQMLSGRGAPGMEGIQTIVQKDMKAVAVGANFSGGIDVKAQLECGSSSDASEIADELDKLLDKAKQQARAAKAGFPFGGGFSVNNSLNDLKVSSSGSTVVATMHIPKNTVDNLTKGFGGGFPFMRPPSVRRPRIPSTRPGTRTPFPSRRF